MIIGLICARAGSKGVPGKNTRMMHGKPLMQWSIDQALACPEIDQVVVSTDCDINWPSNDHVYYVGRPPELARDDIPKWDVWKWVAEHLESVGHTVDAICDLDPTQPLRTVDDITGCIFERSEPSTPATIGIAPAGLSPYYDIVEKVYRSEYKVPLAFSKGYGEYSSRQELPLAFTQSGIYVVTPQALRTRKHLFDGPVYGYEMPRERSFDINDETDWKIVEMLMGDK